MSVKVSKWVDMGAEMDIDISAEDVKCALAEAFADITRDRLPEDDTNAAQVIYALHCIGQFFNGITDEQIRLLNNKQLLMIGEYLAKQAQRFSLATTSAVSG